MKKDFTIVSICVLLFHPFLNAQQVEEIIKKGNDLYKQQQYEPAKKVYDEALTKDSSNAIAKFNLANTTYRLSKPDEAIKIFNDLAFKNKEADDKAKAYYNKGVVLSNQKKLEESIEAYKNSLRQDPNDKEARENLQKALLELKKRTPPPPKKDDQKKKQQQQQNKKQQQQPKMNQKEAEQKLKLLEQKEKQLQQRMQQQKSKTGSGGQKDW